MTRDVPGPAGAQGPLRGQAAPLGCPAGGDQPGAAKHAEGARWRKAPRSGAVFPLPTGWTEPPPRQGMSRRTRQRVSKRRKFSEDVSECLWALNWASGFDGVAPLEPPSPEQTQVLERVVGADNRRQPGGDRLGPEAAGRALLGSRAGYSSAGEVRLASFGAGTVALTEDTSSCPSIHDLARGEARRLLDDWKECMLRGEDDFADLVAAEGRPEAYLDSVLRSNKKKVHDFCKGP